MNDPRRYLTKEEAASYARCSTRTLERAVRAGRLQVGGTRRARIFLPEWLDAWIVAGTETSDDDDEKEAA